MSQIELLSDIENETVNSYGLTAETLYEKCIALARNLWWSWNHEVINLFRDLDPIRWRQLDHNPIALLAEFTAERLEMRAGEMVLFSRINQAYRRLKEYMLEVPAWGRTNTGVLGSRPVAYFSLEFGVHESVPIYSGGLGVLSGDHIKSASALGVPLVACGLFYDQGYFKQHLDPQGYQQEEYLDTKVADLPMEPARGADGKPITVQIDTRTGRLLAKVWLMRVGRVRLFLLDCDVPSNSPEDRKLTSRLYGGDNRVRIRQELVAGVGGIRALTAMGITAGVYHLNEGHSAFATLEAIRQRMKEDGVSFEVGLREVAQRTVFTTHTPVPAGHDRFDGNLVEEHLGPLRDELGISFEQLMGLGRVEPQNDHETFCMTVLGLKLSRKANAVSNLHGHISRRMWANLWPWRAEEGIPIGHITNGVHVPSWLAYQMMQLYDRNFEPGWMARLSDPEIWMGIYDIDPGELWETHYALKNLLLAFVRRRISRQCRRRGESDDVVETARNILDPNVLTIGFARRFATYKRRIWCSRTLTGWRISSMTRSGLYSSSLPARPHPADEPGKQLIKRIATLRFDSRFANRITFIEDYDINVCRHLIQGVDVWLNNPRRPLEASGTSGQKAVLNGALNFSILDGWWAEAFDGTNGFAIGKGSSHVDDRITDARDAASLYEALTEEVIPLFYDRDVDGLPRHWIRRMMNSISTLGWRFSADRMVADYVKQCYLQASGGLSCQMP